ncbi:unnamed protein product [Soboliphyme baturini]|uniref:Uncharacterized protein n=1 Tax=Soboliphyme baturini TaxID=241478 RepID=A0A183IDK0_9BILA|nr:unnamed protein product [Soboliphyme baturini]
MDFLTRVAGLRRLDMVPNTDVCESLGVQSLLLEIEKSPLRWFGHVLRMPPERKAKQLFVAKPTGRRKLLQTPALFCRSSDSGKGSGTLEALSDACASATRKKRPGKMNEMIVRFVEDRFWIKELWINVYLEQMICTTDYVKLTNMGCSTFGRL